jgi:hypothetical protein
MPFDNCAKSKVTVMGGGGRYGERKGVVATEGMRVFPKAEVEVESLLRLLLPDS